jgi:Tol biopolymer transport system component
MGEVYLARDTRLGRPVALKLLSAEFTTNRERLGRLKQEARATSALNHPNIITIYEIGRAYSQTYIVTEFIEGMTLRKRISRGRLQWREAVDLAIQIATALFAAHSHGIVHRDIKPENVMLRTDGYVKVLDFGLAKLLEPTSQGEPGPEDSTVANINTEPGAILGTVAYMSPEQLRRQELDGQTDIWSLGVVLYEMLAGCAPFHQLTKTDLIVSIVERQPPSLSDLASELPSELERIVLKTLRKDKQERYRTVKELLADLKNLKQDFDHDRKPPRSTGPVGGAANAGSSDPGPTAVDTAEKISRTEMIRPARGTSGVEYLIREIRRGGIGSLILIVGFAGMLTIIFLVARAFIDRYKPPEGGPPIEFVEIVKTGGMREAAISPDGNYLAVLVTEAGKQGISVRQIANPNLIPIVVPSPDHYRGLVFSRDGASVYYLKQEGAGWDLFRVATLGGALRKIVSNVSSPVSLSPDGTRLAFIRNIEEGPALFLATADGEEERELAKSPGSNPFAVMRDLNNGPAWAPDGKVIACPTASKGEPYFMTVVAVSVSEGSVKPIDSRKWYVIGQLAWLSDGSGLVMNAVDSELASSTFQLWLLSYPSGAANRITNDLNYYRGVSLTTSNGLLSVNRKIVSSIWLMPHEKTSQATPLVNSKDRGAGGMAWMPDGRIVYSVNGPGNHNIWIMDANGNDAKQLTFDQNADVGPVVSGDGRYIVFTSYRTGEAHIWRMNSDGSDQRQLTFGQAEDWPQISNDGKWIAYHSEEGGRDSIWKISVDGGQPVSLSQENTKQPVFSPDGKLIACFLRGRSDNSPWQIAILPFQGGAPLKVMDAPPSSSQQFQGMQWTPDGRALTYVVTSGEVANIWSQPLSGDGPEQLTDFKENRIVVFAWSTDGSKLACVRSVEMYNLILVKNFKP